MNASHTNPAASFESPGDRSRNVKMASLDPADWLCLAATPTFGLMALLTAVLGGPEDMLCSATQGPSPLVGMVPMYLLMSALHLAPWLKLIYGRGELVSRASV